MTKYNNLRLEKTSISLPEEDLIRKHFKFRPINRHDVRVITGWRYEPPYDFYHMNHPPTEEDVTEFLDPKFAFYTVNGEEGLTTVAFCSFGSDGQVDGGDYNLPCLDIGMGVRPDLTGKGLGSELVSAVCDFATKKFSPLALRVTIAEFNVRALRVWQKAGFREASRFTATGSGIEFVILSRSCD